MADANSTHTAGSPQQAGAEKLCGTCHWLSKNADGVTGDCMVPLPPWAYSLLKPVWMKCERLLCEKEPCMCWEMRGAE